MAFGPVQWAHLVRVRSRRRPDRCYRGRDRDRLGLSSRAIGAQMGWSEKAVDSLLQVYGHVDLVALSEVDALYADKLVPLQSS
jgi:hypothetical protein